MRITILLTFVLFVQFANSQSCRDASVELSAVVADNPPGIMLTWTPNDSATSYFIYRKLKPVTFWGPLLATLPGSSTEFLDTTVNTGISYEYRVIRMANSFTGYGYINAGIEIEAIEDRGIIILVVDDSFIDSLAFEINRLKEDFIGDGWRVEQIDVARTSPVTEVKTAIVNAYAQNPVETKAVFLLGHVPVPYSGEINVDGHQDHTGAYPADVYYADMNGVWTDLAVNNVTAADPRNHNIPGDGKFDQGFIASDLELQIGRVDFFNLPAFALSEQELLRQYLNKDHAYRHKEFSIEKRALIDDNFGYFGGEAFAASGWKNASVLVGNTNVMAGDYFTAMTAGSYLWSYGCGGGWYQGAGGVGSTANFAASDLQSVFTMLFGSYFGDWDTQNNFLRAALAQGKTLTNVWSGRPHWEFHHMGLGEAIGYDVRISQNNNALYTSNFGARIVHMAFMGDPTLRNDVVSPVKNVIANPFENGALIEWTASEDSVLGYYVYLRSSPMEAFTRVNDEIIFSTSYLDPCLYEQGEYEYMVRAIVLQQSPSGSYYNLSQGITDTFIKDKDIMVEADASFLTEGDIVTFINSSSNATSFFWDFGDGSTSTEQDPVHDFIDGDFLVTLIASNECDADTFSFLVSILTGTYGIAADNDFLIYPNPSSGIVFVNLKYHSIDFNIKVYSVEGKIVFEKLHQDPVGTIQLPSLHPGLYIIEASSQKEKCARKIISVL